MVAGDDLIQAMRESCGRLRQPGSNESFITVDHISVMRCNLRSRYFTY